MAFCSQSEQASIFVPSNSRHVTSQLSSSFESPNPARRNLYTRLRQSFPVPNCCSHIPILPLLQHLQDHMQVSSPLPSWPSPLRENIARNPRLCILASTLPSDPVELTCALCDPMTQLTISDLVAYALSVAHVPPALHAPTVADTADVACFGCHHRWPFFFLPSFSSSILPISLLLSLNIESNKKFLPLPLSFFLSLER